jgi:5-methylcytosine-specific restriction endonuclease McrA
MANAATQFKKGQIPWNKTEKVYINCKQCSKEMRLANWQVKKGTKFCSKECSRLGTEYKGLFQKGHSDLVPSESRGHSEETKAKMREINRQNAKYGSEHPLWQGGAREQRKREMKGYPYRDWRTAVFTRDNWTCQCCGIRGGYLEADHIKPWCAFPDLRYDVNNGRTVCRPCHVKLDTHGHKALKYLETQNG